MFKNWLIATKQFLYRFWQALKLVPKLRTKHMPNLFESLGRKNIALLALFAAMIATAGGFLLVAEGDSSGLIPAYGGEHVEGVLGQPRFINPVLAASSTVDSDLSRVIYAQLVKFDKNLAIVPDLAESLPEVTEGQKVYTIKLKQGLRWQDGKPITSEDVVFTVQTIQNSDFESPLKANWNRVKVEKIDDLTVRFTLREISASFITNFTLGILPKHLWQNFTPNNFRLSDNNLKPIGSGPFAIREIKKTADGTIKSITLKANEFYYEGRPYLDRVTFRFYDDYESLINAYQGKEVSSIGYVPFDRKAFLSASTRHQQHRLNLPQYQAVFFNVAKSPMAADKAVRQALWLTTDRQQIIEEVYLGFAEPAFGPILEGNLGYDPSIAQTAHVSLEEANKILDKAGWAMDPAANIRMKNKKPLEITLATNNFVLNVKTAQILQSQWAKLGATINLAIVSAADLEQQYIRPRNFDLLLFSENTGADPDPFPFWHSSQSRDPGLNLSGFSNAESDKLLTAARQTNDTNIRAQNYRQFQKIMANEIPAIFLNSALYVYNAPQKLNGFDMTTLVSPSDRFTNIKNWYIETK